TGSVGGTSSPPTTSPYSSGSDRSLRGTACATLAMVLAVVGVLGRGDVERGVLVEEPEGLELEADVMDGHHGPVLRSREVVKTERVPEDDVLVLDRPPLLDPAWQPVAARVLVGVLARRIALVRCVRRHPDVLV